VKDSEMKKNKKYLFGPINSRRLGISLGIDLIPYKTCTINCVYCECGRTTNLTTERKEYVPTNEVIRELDDYLSERPELDYITFAGSGEPTLHTGIGEIITFLKNKYREYKVALLTNSTLLTNQIVIDDIKNVDLIIPSLDAVSEDVFSKMLRPHSGLKPLDIIAGIRRLKEQYAGKIILEIFLIAGINDTEFELAKIKKICEEIEPAAIQLNSLHRPAADEWVQPMTKQRLQEVRDYLKPLPVQLIDLPENVLVDSGETLHVAAEIISLLERRPSTLEDISFTLGLKKESVEIVLKRMESNKEIALNFHENGSFYCIER
jgi:wyosine [tRNA(Phe)-imidazoG37] synthetase (radical SAM superfamily)